MKRTILVAGGLAACLAVAGCQTTMADVDSTIQRTLPDICRGADAAYASFSVYAISGEVSDNTADRVNLAYGELQRVCAEPDKQTAATVLIAAAQAYAVIAEELDDAKAASQ